jgi:hypothetical protein
VVTGGDGGASWRERFVNVFCKHAMLVLCAIPPFLEMK